MYSSRESDETLPLFSSLLEKGETRFLFILLTYMCEKGEGIVATGRTTTYHAEGRSISSVQLRCSGTCTTGRTGVVRYCTVLLA